MNQEPLQLSAEEVERIEGLLQKAGAIKSCSRCNHSQHAVLPQYWPQMLSVDPNNPNPSSGFVLTLIVTVCMRCGNTNLHSLSFLEMASR